MPNGWSRFSIPVPLKDNLGGLTGRHYGYLAQILAHYFAFLHTQHFKMETLVAVVDRTCGDPVGTIKSYFRLLSKFYHDLVS
jgi:hypothetical protein